MHWQVEQNELDKLLQTSSSKEDFTDVRIRVGFGFVMGIN